MDDNDDSHYDSESFNIDLKKNVASKAAVKKLNIGDFLNAAKDEDDDSYVPSPEKLSQKRLMQQLMMTSLIMTLILMNILKIPKLY